jgi:hypothetical protein
MCPSRLAYAALTLALLCTAVGGCDSVPPRNTAHPAYGTVEYKRDLSQCRNENSKIVMVSGYDDRSEVQVDEAKASGCMVARGWQPTNR